MNIWLKSDFFTREKDLANGKKFLGFGHQMTVISHSS
jgi:hypothetical protein